MIAPSSTDASLLTCSGTASRRWKWRAIFRRRQNVVPFKIASMTRNGPLFDPKLAEFEAAIAIDRIDVVILDPFISFHYLPENDTTSMDQLVKRLGEIAQRRHCCIELSHHVRKPTMGQAEITVYDARGAGAIVNAVRSCRVLNQMSIMEAQQAEIDAEQRGYFIR